MIETIWLLLLVGLIGFILYHILVIMTREKLGEMNRQKRLEDLARRHEAITEYRAELAQFAVDEKARPDDRAEAEILLHYAATRLEEIEGDMAAIDLEGYRARGKRVLK